MGFQPPTFIFDLSLSRVVDTAHLVVCSKADSDNLDLPCEWEMLGRAQHELCTVH